MEAIFYAFVVGYLMISAVEIWFVWRLWHDQ